MWYLIGILIYLVGIAVTYFIVDKWNRGTVETVWYSVFWPVLLPLYLIHTIYNSCREK